MHQAWSKHIFIVSVVAVAFGMLQKPFLALLSFIESLCLAPLSPDWFGGLVFFLVCYLLKREWDYRKIYVPRPVSLWLFLLLGIYLYYRHWEGSFSFWLIPYLGKLAWSDLLLLPWGGAVAIALRPRSKGDYLGIGITLVILCALGYFLLQGKREASLGWLLGSIAIAVVSCLLGYLILRRWGYRLQPEIKKEAQRETELSSLAIDTDSAIVSEKEDWLGFSGMAWILCQNLEMLDLHERSLTVGVIAPWGRGKSSFINLLREGLEFCEEIIVVFNPRGSKSVSSIPEDFFDTFAKELSRHYLGFGLLLARYTKHLGLLNQYAWTRPLGSLLTLLLPGKEQEAVNRTLRELGKRVYVLLDDLDRLSGEEILEVLKLMDRSASFSNTVFITAYDKAYVNNVLKKHLDHGLAHSFIDKYISWEFPLLEPNKEMLERLVGIVLSRKVYAASPICRHIQRSWSQIGRTVVESLDSIRDLKRYLNLVIPRYNGAFSEVDCKDFFLLYLLCYKDFGIYLALHSRRILQLDVPTQTYVLIPNYEEELKRVSQWEGSKSILERLFAPSPEEEETDPWCRSLRSALGFDTYFRGFNFLEGSLYGLVLSEIILSMRKGTLLMDVDDLIRQQGVGRVVDTFLCLVRSYLQGGENRAEAIKTMAYMAFTGNLPEREAEILEEELFEFFSLDRYEKYKELQVAPDLPSYKSLLEPMLTFVVEENPQWISSIIQDLSQEGSVFPGGCTYSIEELSRLLSDHQKSKGAQ
ncbi:P-loop NTPase fold protein [uncultured Porphyromonas sp.]|uniref:P-loop NTPase fold protein n=1 Tax=uncultured Porphyromonas sp. TaxID=159274 RepID=UPI002622F912|nr:P-loop NTPase fold protein [uncultured Porphyromonas sp.]